MRQTFVIILGNISYGILWISGKSIILLLQALRYLAKQFCTYQVQKGGYMSNILWIFI